MLEMDAVALRYDFAPVRFARIVVGCDDDPVVNGSAIGHDVKKVPVVFGIVAMVVAAGRERNESAIRLVGAQRVDFGRRLAVA